MGRLFLVEFDQIPEVHFYCCRVCRTHIALSEDCLDRAEIGGDYFSKVVNLVFNEPCHGQVDIEGPVDDLHCVKCNKPLGWGYIESVPPGVEPIILLKPDVLLFWNGELFRNADQPLPPVVNEEG